MTLCVFSPITLWNIGAVEWEPSNGIPIMFLCQSTTPTSDWCKAHDGEMIQSAKNAIWNSKCIFPTAPVDKMLYAVSESPAVAKATTFGRSVVCRRNCRKWHLLDN